MRVNVVRRRRCIGIKSAKATSSRDKLGKDNFWEEHGFIFPVQGWDSWKFAMRWERRQCPCHDGLLQYYCDDNEKRKMADHIIECILEGACLIEVVFRKVTTDNDFFIDPVLMLDEQGMEIRYQEQCYYQTHYKLNVKVHRSSQKERHRPRKN